MKFGSAEKLGSGSDSDADSASMHRNGGILGSIQNMAREYKSSAAGQGKSFPKFFSSSLFASRTD